MQSVPDRPLFGKAAVVDLVLAGIWALLARPFSSRAMCTAMSPLFLVAFVLTRHRRK